jgi:flagellar basal body-associated protein FliL
MKYKLIVICLTLILVVTGCAMRSAPTSTPQYAEAPREEMASEPGSRGASGSVAYDAAAVNLQAAESTKMIIYNAELSLVVKDSGVAQEDITKMVEGVGGYVSNSSSNTYSGGLRRITLTLRLPAEKFNEAMTSLRDMAMEVTQETIGTEDVTQEYVDLESRLRALEAKADRLEELMDQAEDTEAVLAVYEQLSQTQIEIEQTKGRMQYLERSAAMATITVSLTPDELSQPIEVAGWRPVGIAKTAFEALIRVFQVLIGALIWIVILVIPVLLFLGGLFYLVIKVLGLIFGRRKRTPKTPPAPPTADA